MILNRNMDTRISNLRNTKTKDKTIYKTRFIVDL
jgi:hypothetical protein